MENFAGLDQRFRESGPWISATSARNSPVLQPAIATTRMQGTIGAI
jgi:hypothetical protein